MNDNIIQNFRISQFNWVKSVDTNYQVLFMFVGAFSCSQLYVESIQIMQVHVHILVFVKWVSGSLMKLWIEKRNFQQAKFIGV